MNPEQRRALVEMAEAGVKLVHELKEQFPSSDRCIKCGFRLAFHAPANHQFTAYEHPVVVFVQEYVSKVGAAIERAMY